MDLSLYFDDGGRGHNDLTLRFAGQSWKCDSYYLALDQGILPNVETADKVRLVLRRLLEQWLSALEELPISGIIFLPYDFSDQYTAWLRCERKSDGVTVSRGWATVEGYSFFPSAVGEFVNMLPGFRVDGPSILVDISELVEAVRDSMRVF